MTLFPTPYPLSTPALYPALQLTNTQTGVWFLSLRPMTHGYVHWENVSAKG